MKTKYLTTSIFTLIKMHLFFLLLMCTVQSVISQTISGSYTQTPCNNDGIYSVTTTGLTPPITYTYNIGPSWSSSNIVHANINSTTDQLTNIPMYLFGKIYVQESD